MTEPTSGTKVGRGARTILIGMVLAPAITNVLMFFVSWQMLAPGRTDDPIPTIHALAAWTALAHALLILPILPGVWWFAPGWTPRAATARVLSVVVVLAWLVLAVRRFAQGNSPAPDATPAAVVSVLTTTLYGGLAAVSASLAHDLRRRGLRGLAIVTLALCAVHVVAMLASFVIPLPGPLFVWLNFGVWAAAVISVWRTGRAVSIAAA